jgi:hypothetical protein
MGEGAIELEYWIKMKSSIQYYVNSRAPLMLNKSQGFFVSSPITPVLQYSGLIHP